METSFCQEHFAAEGNNLLGFETNLSPFYLCLFRRRGRIKFEGFERVSYPTE